MKMAKYLKGNNMATAEKEIVSTKKVICDGGGGSLGHPKVYLSIKDENGIECSYCGKSFVFKKDKK